MSENKLNRSEPQCNDCMIQRLEPPECSGHPIVEKCDKFEGRYDSQASVTYTVSRAITVKCPKCGEKHYTLVEDMNDYQLWCIDCDLILNADEEVVWDEDLKEIKPGDKEW